MSDITVDCQKDGSGWTCDVTVEDRTGQSRHTVSVPEDDYRTLSEGDVDVDELVRESFEFLLDREPRQSIMAQFDIMTISRYFPEYENRITDRLN